MLRGPSCDFEVEAIPLREQIVLVLRGELDLASAPALKSCLVPVIDVQPARLVFDMSQLHFIDCAGARVIAEARASLPAPRCEIVLWCANRLARMVVETLGLDGPCVIEG